MPIKIPDSLPARETLENENIFVMTELRAVHQDIRPLKLLVLNLMPTKIVTETQILRKLSNTPLQIEVELLQTSSHISKNIDPQHLESFYTTFDKIKDNFYDGMVITGAPVELMEFEEVDYWQEMCEIMEWTKTNVHSTLHLCWGALAALYYHYGVPKINLSPKLLGVYKHEILSRHSPFFRGFDDTFYMPHSRSSTISEEDIKKVPDLRILSTAEKAGIFAMKTEDNRQFFVMGHPEYDVDTLAIEYARDKASGKDFIMPENYFPDNDPGKIPPMRWRAHGQLLYTNWLNYYVYQTTPYDIRKVGSKD